MELIHESTGLVAIAATTERINSEWSFRIKSRIDIPDIDYRPFGIEGCVYEYCRDKLGNPFYLAFYPEGFPLGEFPLKDWVVEIPEKFRLGLERKYNLIIKNTPCELCSVYAEWNCEGCPFDIFRSEDNTGCVRFLRYLESRCEVESELFIGRDWISVKNEVNYRKFLEFARHFVKFIPDM